MQGFRGNSVTEPIKRYNSPWYICSRANEKSSEDNKLQDKIILNEKSKKTIIDFIKEKFQQLQIVWFCNHCDVVIELVICIFLLIYLFFIQFFTINIFVFIFYILKGSHGSWSSAGIHSYRTLPNGMELVDECSKGQRWYTWRKMVIGIYDPTGCYEFGSPIGFIRFKGRWGNEKRECKIIAGLEACVLVSGPLSPPWSFKSAVRSVKQARWSVDINWL